MSENGFPPPEHAKSPAEVLDRFLPEETYITQVIDPETNQEMDVCDISEIQSVLRERREAYKQHGVNQTDLVQALSERHRDDLVLTPDQVANGDFVSKHLFYIPDSADTVAESARDTQSAFHTTIWDMQTGGIKNRNELHPTDDGSEITSFEVRAGLELFHPDRGAAYRAENGSLMVRMPQEEGVEEVWMPINDQVLRAYGLDGILKTETGHAARTIREGVQEELPHLLALGALRIEDFSQRTVDSQGEYLSEFEPKEVPANGYVTIRGVRQYVGKKFAGMLVQALGGETAMVFDTSHDGKQKTLLATFTVVPKDEAILDIGTNDKVVPRTTAKHTKLQSVDLVALETDALSTEMLSQQVSAKLAELVSGAKQAEQLVEESLRDQAVDAAVSDKVREMLYVIANKMIDSVRTADTAEDLLDQLDQYQSDVSVFVTVLQQVGVERMADGGLEHVPSEQVTEEQKTQMRSLLQENYERLYPGEEYETFRAKIAQSLEDAFSNPLTSFRVLTNGDDVVSYNRFDAPQMPGGPVYFGSFNADSDYKGVGSVMLEQTISAELKTHERMMAHCDPTMPISQKYIEDGFVATQTEVLEGVFSFEIWRSQTSGEQLQTKQMTVEELVAIAEQTQSLEQDYFVREVDPGDQFHELDDGLAYLLTRYFTHKGKTYVAFELNTAVAKDFQIPEPDTQPLAA